MRRISDEALRFSLMMIKGKNIKAEEIFKLMTMGDILRTYSEEEAFDDTVVAAGYLYILRQEKLYTNNEIARRFGGCVSSALTITIKLDDSLPSKKQQIKAMKDYLPEKNRPIIAASLIADLERKRIEFQENGKAPFETEEELANQRWYLEAIFQILEDDYEHPILERLHENIIALYYDLNLDFKPALNDSSKKEMTPAQQLSVLRDILGNSEVDKKPFIYEFTNEPKRTLGDIVENFFENNAFQIKVVDESQNINRYEQEHITDNSGITHTGMYWIITSEVKVGLLSEVAHGKNVILVEQGLFERFTWLKRYLDSGQITKEEFQEYMKYYISDLEALINFATINYLEPAKCKNSYQDAIVTLIKLLNGEIVDTGEQNAHNIVRNLSPMIPGREAEVLDFYVKSLKNTA